jgi:phosphatidylglycerophosphate synthase
MDKFSEDFITKFQVYRSKKLKFIAEICIKIGLKAHKVTFISLLMGIIAVYFLFNNFLIFVIFSLLHLFFDSLDGVIARLTKESIFGKILDRGSDQIVIIIALFKVGWLINDFYVYIVAILYLIAVLIHLFSSCRAPIMMMRTISLVVLAIASFPSFAYTNIILTYGYLIAGVFTIFSLAKQLQWFLD